MNFGSVCSGIEAASVAWNGLGWKAAWLSEIEPFPCAVLAHHYPDTPNLGDMTLLPEKIKSGEVPAPDLLCGGTPCQAFSVAGLRKSLDDARGNLTLTFCEIADAIDAARAVHGKQPSIIVWENVPGVLNTKDNAFGCFLGALAGCDSAIVPNGRWTNAGMVAGPKRAVAWRVLDAQYFGVAQRRRRVFVVASARDNFDPASVLFEFDGLRRDSAPSRQAGQKPAPSIAGCSNGGGANGPGRDVDSVESLQVITTAHGQGGAEIGFDRGPTLTCNHEAPIAAYTTKMHNTSANNAGKVFEEYSTCLDANSPPPAVFQPIAHVDTMPTLRAGAPSKGPGHGARSGDSKDEYIVPVAQPIAWDEELNPFVDVAGTLLRGGAGGRHDGVMQPIPIDTMNMTPGHSSGGLGFGQPGDPSFTLTKGHSHAVAQPMPVGIFQDSEFGVQKYDSAGTLRAGRIPEHQMVMQPISFHPTQDPISSADVCHSIGANDNATAAVMQQFVAPAQVGPCMGSSGPPYSRTGNERVETEALAVTTIPPMQVRRLTPVECERLQGFPDGYTAIPWRKKPASECPDGPRYKALGNSWAVPVVRWIGQRICRMVAFSSP